MGAAGLMTQYQGVGLGAVDQAHGHAGKRGMEQRALTLNHVPMIGVVGRSQRFDRAGDEVGHDGVDRHSLAGDENTGLAGGTKIGFYAAAMHFPLYCQGGEHFTDRAIGADRQQPLTWPFNAVADIEILGWMANVEQLSAVACGGFYSCCSGAYTSVWQETDERDDELVQRATASTSRGGFSAAVAYPTGAAPKASHVSLLSQCFAYVHYVFLQGLGKGKQGFGKGKSKGEGQ